MTLNAADRDPAVSPGTDFYRFANGGWQDANPIPAGYGAWGAFEEVQTRNEDTLRQLLEHAAADPSSNLDRQLGDYFASGMDLDAIEAKGLSAIEPMLARIAAIESADDLLALLPPLHRAGFTPLFAWATDVDFEDSSKHMLWLAQSGLGLPDRDSYFDESDAAVALRSAYVGHVARQLTNADSAGADAEALAADVLAFETQLAERQMKTEERRDTSKTLNRHDVDQLRALDPALDLPGYLTALGAGAATSVNVESPSYFSSLRPLIANTPVSTLRGYLAFQVISGMADALPKAIDDESFDFYGRLVQGKKEQRERYKRVIGALGSDMGEAVGQRFVEDNFPPSAKERALSMVDEIVAEMRTSLETREWMSDATRAEALTKLESFTVKIGYPDKWRDWAGLEIRRDDYALNRLNAAAFEVQRQLDRITEPVDPDEWEMPAHAVNAYYHPLRNEIVFPAGILQPPMFDADADDAVNFGGIGAVIAHEITHGFDDQGRRFDANGAFRDWWTSEDEAHFTAIADRLVEQFDAYEVLPGVAVNGRLTLGENIADLGGLALAQRAHARISAGAPEVDGLTPAQRFFLAHATLWRANTSEELTRTLVQIDPHSPRPLRVKGPFSNMAAFAAAFDLDDDAPMLRPQAERIEIW